MIKHGKRAVRELNTHSVSTHIFNGTDELCQERFGFKTAGGRTSSHLAVKAFSPSPKIGSISYALELPAIESTIFLTVYGQIYKWNYEEGTVKNSATLNPVRMFVAECTYRGENAYTIFGGSQVCFMMKDSQTIINIPYMLYCGTFHKGRVFARDYDDPYLIRWSDYGTSEWTRGLEKGGNVRLNTLGGEVVGMVSFGDKLILVRKNAVCVMRASGDVREFSIEQSEAYAVPTVTPFTSVICGGQLWFHTEQGLYSFNGHSLSVKPFPDYIKGYTAYNAISVRGRYVYVNLQSSAGSCVLEYDTYEDCFTRIASSARFICELKGKLYCHSGINVLELNADVGSDDYFWRSKKVDLGTGRCKTLKRLIAEGEGELTYEIDCDGRKRVVRGFGEIAVGERAQAFTFTVRGTGSLKRLTAEWEVNS